MSEFMPHFFYAFAFVVSASIISLFLSVRWNLFYFQFGIPVFYRRYSVETPINFTSSVDRLERKFQGTFWHYSLQFKVINESKCLFRQKPIEFRMFHARNIPIVHGGVLQYHSAKGSLTVIGYLSWSLLTVILGGGYLITIRIQTFPAIPLIVFGIMMSVIYWFEFRRYDEMGKLAASLSKNRRYTSKKKC
jgi:hypothetical protein